MHRLRRVGLALGACLAVAIAAVVLGARPAPGPGAPAAPAEDPVTRPGGIVRHDLRFACGADTCAGWLFRPPAPATPPVVVMGHGFAGTRDVALEPFALRFADRGLAAFAFDYRGFGASGGSPRQLVDPWRQVEDWHAAIAFVRGRPDLDGARPALWGSSMGAGHALVAAAEDGRVAAVVAQAPLVDTRTEGEAARLSAGAGLRLLLTAWADLVQANWSDEALQVPALAGPDRFGMIRDAAARDAFETLVAEGSSYRNAVAARSILTFDDYNPALQAADLEAPTLLVASPEDRFAPYEAAVAFAAAHDSARLAAIDGDHFDVYAPPRREAAARLAADFLAATLARGTSGRLRRPAARRASEARRPD